MWKCTAAVSCKSLMKVARGSDKYCITNGTLYFQVLDTMKDVLCDIKTMINERKILGIPGCSSTWAPMTLPGKTLRLARATGDNGGQHGSPGFILNCPGEEERLGQE